MKDNELELVRLILNSPDPEKAIEIAISVITDFLNSNTKKEVSK